MCIRWLCHNTCQGTAAMPAVATRIRVDNGTQKKNRTSMPTHLGTKPLYKQ